MKWLLTCTLLLVVTLYVGAYFVISRRGYAEADFYGFKGFYYITPEPGPAWEQRHAVYRIVFAPLNLVDRTMGYGRRPAAAPMWGLKRSELSSEQLLARK